MDSSYPKSPSEIQIRITHQNNEGGILSPIKAVATVFLKEKLDDYLLRLGYTSAYTLGIVVHLMTQSKVVVDFRDYRERLELMDPHDRISSPQAIGLLEDYIARHVGGADVRQLKKQAEQQQGKWTQRIVIAQPPRR